VTKQRILLWAALGLAIAIVAAGCGNAQNSSSGEPDGSKAACKTAATTKPTGLRSLFRAS